MCNCRRGGIPGPPGCRKERRPGPGRMKERERAAVCQSSRVTSNREESTSQFWEKKLLTVQ